MDNKCLSCQRPIEEHNSYIHKNGKKYFSKNKKPKKYCSLECSKHKNTKHRKDITCPTCNKTMSVKKSSKQVFCDKNCATNRPKPKISKTIKADKSPKTNKIPPKRLCEKCQLELKYRQRKLCDICQKESVKNRERQRAKIRIQIKMRIAKYIKSILIEYKGGSCSCCGYNKSMRALCFHHTNPKNKSFTIDASNIMKKGLVQSLIESNKCVVLCQRCHSNLHEKERKNNIKLSYLIKYNKYTNRKFNYILRSPDCKMCGYQFTYDNLQSASFHHNNDKCFPLDCQAFLNRSDSELDLEFGKCTLLCVNCHMELEESLANKF